MNRNSTRSFVLSSILVGFSFLLFSFIVIKLIAPESNSNADTTTGTVGPYSMSMSSVSNVDINIAPTPEQRIYKKEANLSITNTCPDGASVNMVSKTSSSNLVQIDLEEGQIEPYIIEPTTSSDSTTMSNNSWGYSIDNGTNWFKLPTNLESPVSLYNSETSQPDPLVLPLLFGVKADITLHSGTYKTEVLYTMTPKPNCYSYNITWDYNNGTKKPNVTYPTSLTWGQTINLSTLTPERDGYTFTGWTSGEGDNATEFTGTETNADINPNNLTPLTIRANWRQICTDCEVVDVDLNVNESQGFDYIGKVAQANLKKVGYYKLETWGAQGGDGYSGNSVGGYGGYSYGNIVLSGNNTVYVVVGGKGGKGGALGSKDAAGGFNGGGIGGDNTNDDQGVGGGGGGATHIAMKQGVLAGLESDKESILIVSGGGGGSISPCTNSEGRCLGGSGGGFIGRNGTTYYGGSSTYDAYSSNWSSNYNCFIGIGGNQTSGGRGGKVCQSSGDGLAGSFGHGGSGTRYPSNAGAGAGGGGGYYGGGGGAGFYESGGGGGSGYIANELLSNKGMYTYKLTVSADNSTDSNRESTEINTKTTYTSNYSSTPASNYAKQGNGYAKITYLGTSI